MSQCDLCGAFWGIDLAQCDFCGCWFCDQCAGDAEIYYCVCADCED